MAGRAAMSSAGDEGSDTLHGDDGDDFLYGGEGVDVLDGGLGSDVLRGDEDADYFFGDRGDDLLFGDEGNDYMSGGAGDDELDGDEGADRLFGGEGSDYLSGGAGDDELDGEEGDDFLVGDEGVDSLSGGAGDDTLAGGTGGDTLSAGAGDDFLFGDEGDDDLFGGEGDDVLCGGEGDDRLYGDAGLDLACAVDDFVTVAEGMSAPRVPRSQRRSSQPGRSRRRHTADLLVGLCEQSTTASIDSATGELTFTASSSGYIGYGVTSLGSRAHTFADLLITVTGQGLCGAVAATPSASDDSVSETALLPDTGASDHLSALGLMALLMIGSGAALLSASRRRTTA